MDPKGRKRGWASGTRTTAKTHMQPGHTVSRTPVFSPVYLPLPTSFLSGSAAGVSGPPGGTCGPTSAPPGHAVLSLLPLERDRFPQFQLQNGWGRRGLSWLGSDVYLGPMRCG